MSRRDSEDFAEETRDSVRLLKGMHRRMAVRRTSSTKWQVLGQRGGQGGDELVELEPFTGIGFYARPPSSGKAEVITAAIGGPKTSVIIATRDEKTRRAVAGGIAEGETCVYNDKAMIVVKADGTVEIRLAGGVAVALALKSDVQQIRNELHQHTHGPGTFNAPGGGGPVTGVSGAGPAVTAPTGTMVLKGQ